MKHLYDKKMLKGLNDMPNTQPWSPTNAQNRTDAAFEKIKKLSASKSTTFLITYEKEASEKANTLTSQKPTLLSGALLSIKDLFDEQGQITTSGSKILAKNAPALEDAPCVAAMKHAGCIAIGRTNMTELAYSGLGINPHFGTPENSIFPGCIPGGSSSGAAVSVAENIVDIALGSDTGGSVRIPAAFNGIVGFKPSQSTISCEGVNPLSHTLDSIGPLAKTIEACELAWKAMANLPIQLSNPKSVSRKYIIPTNFGLTELSPEIEKGFETLENQLLEKGFEIERRHLPSLDEYQKHPVPIYSIYECHAHYKSYFETTPELFDPRVYSRLSPALTISQRDYDEALIKREKMIENFNTDLNSASFLLPTVAILPPKFECFETDEEYGRLNKLALRNTSLGNIMNTASISLPVSPHGTTFGFMITRPSGDDQIVLDQAKDITKTLAKISLPQLPQ